MLCLRSSLLFLDTEHPPSGAQLQVLTSTLQGVQSRYDEIVRVEDQRLKLNATKARKHAAEKLGNAKSIEQAAARLMDTLMLAKKDLVQKGTIGVFEFIIFIRLSGSLDSNLDAITLEISTAQADLMGKRLITANHSAAEDVARAQQLLYDAADLMKDLKTKMKSTVLTGTCALSFDCNAVLTYVCHRCGNRGTAGEARAR